MRINGRRRLMMGEMNDLVWRNVRQCYVGETAYGIKAKKVKDPGSSWAFLVGKDGNVVSAGPDIYNGADFYWANNGARISGDFVKSPYWAEQSDGTYLFTPFLYRPMTIDSIQENAYSQYFLVRSSEPIQ